LTIAAKNVENGSDSGAAQLHPGDVRGWLLGLYKDFFHDDGGKL